MVDLKEYLEKLTGECRAAFGGRLLYVGLQGSHMRGEATENSDIDVMILLERFTVQDMDTYRGILERIGHRDQSCGFICGREEITRWNPLEVCQLRYTTKDLYGCLADYLPEASREDEINYVRVSLGNLYHELCHRYIHAGCEKSRERFRGSCKQLFFLIQNMHYLESGEFIVRREDLKARVTEEDRSMLKMAELPDSYDFDGAFSAVFRWCQDAFIRADRMG